MKSTFRERTMNFCRDIVRKYRFLRIPIFLILVVIMAVHGAVTNLFSGWKRYACTAFVLLFFVVGCSFAYPVFSYSTGFLSQQGETVVAQETTADSVKLAPEANVELENIAILDDDDVLEGYEDAELHGMAEVDKYSLDEIIGSEETYQGNENEQTEETTQEYQFLADDWRLVLINKQHPIPEDYTFSLGTIKGSMQCDDRIIDDLLLMLQGAKNDGVNLVICSPYRDLNRQQILFNRKIEAYMSKGMSYMEAYKISSQAVTVPGASEHQIGLAIDIISDSYVTLDEGFGDTVAGKWLAAHSCEYGFILRYPLGKEYITSIEFEPWHFRYVGKEAAKVITEQGITLEEFVDKYL